MKLLDVKSGKKVCIVGYEGSSGVELKLRKLGLLPGDTAKVIRHAPLGGPLLIECKGRQIALGRGVAVKILVEEV
ncbi:ferrous iron transport protein A [Chloroflexota bacterium]